MFRAYDHPSEGALDLLDSGLRLNRERLPVRRHQPVLGEHGSEVLREAGLDDDAIAAALDCDD